ncbi:MAG: UDP-glucose/GDP-mannose dehydrogenase family protein [Alphaproteobacteria bacterium]|nr:UDP-glucose/GDP-mannose dehydrogenase family protein [Alphaproteobacteria bacterium]
MNPGQHLPVVGFAGMTHLGLVSAAATAAKGFTVVGVDPDAQRIDAVTAGRLPISEPELEELLAAARPHLQFSADWAAMSACDLVYVAMDVPTDESGSSNLAPVRSLIGEILKVLRSDALLVVLCQVPPGFTRALPVPPERLFYQVETLIFGRAVERANWPERFTIGCAAPDAPLPPALHTVLAAFGCPVLPMRYESAELAKIAINCCLMASVTVSNTLAGLCEKIGADWGEILPALKLDRRIGPYSYLAPGLGLAGGNLERDLATVRQLALETGCEASLIEAFLTGSRDRRDWVLRLLHRELLAEAPKARIGVLGLAYKENTDSTKNSPSLALIEHLHPWPIRVFDPVVPASVLSHPAVSPVNSAAEVATGVDALVVMTPWPEFRDLDLRELRERMRGRLLVDPFRVFDAAAAAAAGLSYRTLGRS